MAQSIHVVVAHYDENLDWAKNIKYPVIVISRNGIPEGTMPNKGREASSYLEYIIQNYNSLPDYVVFVHGHRNSWHHKENIDETINRLNFKFNYCNINDSVPIRDINTFVGERNHMLDYIKYIESILNTKINIDNYTYKLGAQFYVTRESILSRSHKQYIDLYDLIMKQHISRSRSIAVLFERLWHFIFTHETTYTNQS